MAMNFWDFALLGAAAYVAIVTLVRMMRHRRDALIDELTQAAEADQRRLRGRTDRASSGETPQEQPKSRPAA